jgi:hypothetical protein
MAINGGWLDISIVIPANNQNVLIISRYFAGAQFTAVYQATARRFSTSNPAIFFNNPDVLFWKPI